MKNDTEKAMENARMAAAMLVKKNSINLMTITAKGIVINKNNIK